MSIYPFEDLRLVTDRLLIRTLDPSYAPIVLDYWLRNREFFRPWNPRTDDSFYTLAAQTASLQRSWAQMHNDQGYRFWLFLRDDPACTRVIGDIGLSNIVRGAFQSCHLGYKIDQAHGGAGLITEALRAVIDLAFDQLKLHRIEANIMPRNTRSLRVVEKLGFAYEGLGRRYLQIDGVWEDHLHYALINQHNE